MPNKKITVDGSTIIRFKGEYDPEELAERFDVPLGEVLGEPEEFAQRAFREDVRAMVPEQNMGGIHGSEALWSGVDHFKATPNFAQRTCVKCGATVAHAVGKLPSGWGKRISVHTRPSGFQKSVTYEDLCPDCASEVDNSARLECERCGREVTYTKGDPPPPGWCKRIRPPDDLQGHITFTYEDMCPDCASKIEAAREKLAQEDLNG